MIYLDYASNTPADPRVLEAFCQAERDFPGNPNSDHALGRAARGRLDDSVARVAALLGISSDEVILTSGASEANNLAIKGIAHANRHRGRHILTTCLEHPSVSGAVTALQEQGWEPELLDLGPDGRVDLSHLRELLRKDTVLVSVCWVDSELGTVQPIPEIAALVAGFPGCRLHVDATQAFGKIPLSLDGVHCLTLTPHKCHGLNGIGVLARRGDTVLSPLIHGGTGASVYRAGTPTVALAASLAHALELAEGERASRFRQVSLLRRRLEERLVAYPKVRINSTGAGVPHILNLSVAGVKGTAFQEALDRRGVCVSVKSACSVPGAPSRPVMAVTGDRKNALWSWRISLSHLTTEEELEEFMERFDQCVKELEG